MRGRTQATAPLCLPATPLRERAMPDLEKPDSAAAHDHVKWRFPSVHPEGRKYVVGSRRVTRLAYLLH